MSTQLTAENNFNLGEVTHRLRHLLDSLSPASASNSFPVRMVAPRQMSALLSELTRAGAWLRSRPDLKSAVFAEELSEYRREVERLRALLPSLQAALLQERARLELQRERVQNTEEWARTSSQTL